jgi:hypothetical protein
MNTSTKKNNKLTFACECNGCRGYAKRPAEIWHESQIASKANGYYFSRDTMRIFSSRISDFKPVGISPSGVDSLMVIVSSRYDIDGAKRYYEIITLCPYGELNREFKDSDNGEPINRYTSLNAARKSARWNCTIAALVCSCHGCQIDRAGR